ncbi:MAG: ion transporter [Proteobacteria bacterium]|nr:ion transporter [Pseudomonadota bacterium]
MKALAENAYFQNFVTVAILAAGVVVGLETYPSIAEAYHTPLWWANNIILGIFIVEVIVKMVAEGKTFWRYFYDPWNVFDFIIVALCLMPFGGGFVAVLRLLRVLRVLKLVTALPKLQILVGALLKSIPSMVYVSMLLGLLFYLYAVTATFFFSANDPIHFETLQLSMLSLFRTVTLEDWTDLMYINMYGCENYGYDGNEELCTASEGHPVMAAAFFVSFVLSGTMIILNLFIGVIMNGMEEAQAEAEELAKSQRTERPSLAQEMAGVASQLADLQRTLAALQVRAELEADAAKEAERLAQAK